MANSDPQYRSSVMDLRLAADQVEQLVADLEAESVGDVVANAKTNLLSMPSVSGTASQMKSLLRLNKLSKHTDQTVAEVVARCNAITGAHPDVILEDGTGPNEVKARALYTKARLLVSMIPAMNMFKRKNAYREAIAILRESLNACLNQPSYLAIGFCLTEVGDRQGAASAYQSCIDLDDSSENALEAARRQRGLGLR